MTRPRRSVGILLTILAFSACGLDRPDLARVGDRDVGEEDLRTALAMQRTLADLQGVPCGQASEGETEAAACRRFALSGELLWLAISDYAERRDLIASEAEVEEVVVQLETQVGEQVLGEALASHDLARSDLVELGRRILTIREVRSTIAGERVGEDALRKLYDERSLEFTIVEANHILVRTEAEARSVYRRVRDAGEARFIEVAREVSIEPTAAEQGGRLGARAASSYDPAFGTAAVALEPGQVSAPVQTQFGWHVIYLVDEQVTSFEEARAGLLEPLADREFRAWLQERAEALDIQVNPRFGRFVPQTFSIEPVRSTDPEGDARTPSP